MRRRARGWGRGIIAEIVRGLFAEAPGGAGAGGGGDGAGGGAAGAGAGGAGAGAGGAGSGAGGAGGASGGQGEGAGAGGSGAGAGGGEPSLLSQAAADVKAGDKVELPGEADDPAKFIPEKYRVMKGEGDAAVLDPIASAKKLADAHAELEKRAGSLGLPPEKPADYKVTLPEVKDGDKTLTLDPALLEGPVLEKFRADAHAAGYTQKQFDAAVQAHVVGLGHFAEALAEQGASLAQKELETDPEWQGAEKLKRNMGLAYRTFAAFATPEEAKEIDRIGNNPIFLKILARAGGMLGEDRLRGSGPAAIVDDSTIDQYMGEGSPYWDSTHKDHKRVKDIVTRHFAAKHGTKPVAPSTMG